MDDDSGHWFELGEPATPAERQALDCVRKLLPANQSTFAWPNATVIDPSGRIDELDLLLLCRRGLFVVELKGWHGTIDGNQQSWRVRSASGKVRRTAPNPLLLTEAKARRLASTLKYKAPGRSGSQVPFIAGMVVMHGQDSHLSLDDIGQTRIYALDGYGVMGLHAGQTFKRFVNSDPDAARHLIDANRAKQIVKIIGAAGLRPTPKTRMAGQFPIERDTDPVAEGPNWQDVVAHHPQLDDIRVRVRLFDIPARASAAERAEIEEAAKRAHKLTYGLNHVGIEKPKDYVDTDSGPALIYDYEENARSIGDYLVQREEPLSLDERMILIRQIGETLAFAHERRVVHRGLTPRQVYVTETSGRPEIRIRDWQTGRRSRGESTSVTTLSRGADDPRSLVDGLGWVYIAPEAHRLGGSDDADDLPSVPLDVYGFGSLAYLILTDTAPAESLAELQSRLADNDGLNPQRDDAALTDDFAIAILAATAATESDRTSTVAGVLTDLERAYRKVEESQVREAASDPLDATDGQEIADRFNVIERRGSGSTGVAFCVDDYVAGREGVILKVANDDAAAERLDAEAGVLESLDNPRVVRLHDGPIDVDGRQALVLSDAGARTLAAQLSADGRATLEQLERFGADLFEAIAYLDDCGVFHRDVKPANLGVTTDPSTRRPRLVLFDFSLSREPLRNIGSGTRRYLDPFLDVRGRRQYDRAAELYAIAVTLFEMASNESPWWHEGNLAPASISDRVALTEQLFESSIATELVGFFRRAFAPDVSDRFEDVAEMAAAWRAVFARLVTDTADTSVSEADRDADADKATLSTPLTLAGLSPHALSALERLSVTTVHDLLTTNPTRINAISGLGETHRKEVQRRIRQWRARLLTTATESVNRSEGDRSVESVLTALVPRPNRDNRTKVACLRLLLGIATPVSADDDEATVTDSLWPTAGELADLVGVTRARISQVVGDAAARWGKVIGEAHGELITMIDSADGVATLEEAAQLLLAAHGSRGDGRERLRLAAGLVRAVCEYDGRRTNAVFTMRRRRSDGLVLLALDPSARERANDSTSPEALLAHAGALGKRADGLLDGGAIVPAARARAALQAESIEGVGLGPERMLRLAAGASERAALSDRGELYPRSLSGADAVRHVLRSRPMREVATESLRKRVRERFPALADVPPSGAALDALVREVFPDARRDGDTYALRRRSHSAPSAPSSVSVATKGPSEVDRVLRASLRARSSLALAVTPREYERAAHALADAYDVRRVDVATDLVGAVRRTASDKRVDWEVVRAAGAQPAGSADGTRLRQLVDAAYAARWAELLESEDALLLTNVAPMIRYGMASRLSDVLDLGTTRPAARWVLVPRRRAEASPRLDGELVPLGPSGWVDLPHELVANAASGLTNSEKVRT